MTAAKILVTDDLCEQRVHYVHNSATEKAIDATLNKYMSL